jgi:hypothetical protein
MNIRLDIAREGSKFFVGGNLFFGTLAIAEDALRRFLIVPEIGIGYASLESFQALAILWDVKDSSARAWCAA